MTFYTCSISENCWRVTSECSPSICLCWHMPKQRKNVCMRSVWCQRCSECWVGGVAWVELAGAGSQVQLPRPKMHHLIYQLGRDGVIVSILFLFSSLSCLYPSPTANTSAAHSHAPGGSPVTFRRQIYFRLCCRALIAHISTHTQSFPLYIFSWCACAKTVPTKLQRKARSAAELSSTCKQLFNTSSSWINKGTLWKWKWFPRELVFTICCQI